MPQSASSGGVTTDRGRKTGTGAGGSGRMTGGGSQTPCS